MRNSGLKRTLEHLRHAELEFLQSVSGAEIDEEFLTVKSELDEFRNLVWSHLAAGARHGARAQQLLESMRMHRIVEMLRTLNQSQRHQVDARVSSGQTFPELTQEAQDLYDRTHA